MTAADDSIAATVEQLALTMRGTVYGRGAGGQYDDPVKLGLKCSLDRISDRQSAATNAQRAELANGGNLEWERSYSLPDNAQIEVDKYPGQRWNLRKGTVWPEFGPGGGLISWRCDVVKAT